MTTNATQLLLLRIRRGDDYLLLRQRDDLPLDPGHWCLPSGPLTDATAAPHPALCGLPAELAPGLRAQLDVLGIEWGQIEELRPGPTLDSPPWHPRRLQARIVDIRLGPTTAACRLPPYALDQAWNRPSAWETLFGRGQLLLNPLARQLLIRPEAADWQNWQREEPLAGLHVLPVRSNTLPPASHTNAFVFGDDPRILVDPSPADNAAYAELLDRLHVERPEVILLTHHHPDHHQHAPRLARELNLPIWCSKDTLQRIPSRFGRDYFRGIPTRDLADGETLSSWCGQPVTVCAVPGHDAGQIALAPASRAWMIVGDLIQGIGTVVIAEPEGDMAQYFDTLRRVIAEAPAVILPSHGQAMGGTHRIEATLKHRLQRENQILQLRQAGADSQAILESIYRGVDRRLWGLARMNIDSHLKKLRDEGRLTPEA